MKFFKLIFFFNIFSKIFLTHKHHPKIKIKNVPTSQGNPKFPKMEKYGDDATKRSGGVFDQVIKVTKEKRNGLYSKSLVVEL